VISDQLSTKETIFILEKNRGEYKVDLWAGFFFFFACLFFILPTFYSCPSCIKCSTVRTKNEKEIKEMRVSDIENKLMVIKGEKVERDKLVVGINRYIWLYIK